MRTAERLDQYDSLMIVTDYSEYGYLPIVREARLVVDTRNATRRINSPKLCAADLFRRERRSRTCLQADRLLTLR